MTSKTKSSGEMGEFIVPIIDVASVAIMKIVEWSVKGILFLITRYVVKSRPVIEIKKIERSDLNCKKSTLKMKELGYSVTQKKSIHMSELNKTKHTAIVGASGSGKTVLLDVLMYDDMHRGKPVIYIDPKGGVPRTLIQKEAVA